MMHIILSAERRFFLQDSDFYLPCANRKFFLDLTASQDLRLQSKSLSNHSRIDKILPYQILDIGFRR